MSDSEHIEGLQEVNTKLLQAFDTKMRVHHELNKNYVELKEQNKKYREALESVLNNDEMIITNQEIILEALEVSK